MRLGIRKRVRMSDESALRISCVISPEPVSLYRTVFRKSVRYPIGPQTPDVRRHHNMYPRFNKYLRLEILEEQFR